jgi:hypothetical protein
VRYRCSSQIGKLGYYMEDVPVFCTGAKAAAEARRDASTTDFMVKICCSFDRLPLLIKHSNKGLPKMFSLP